MARNQFPFPLRHRVALAAAAVMSLLLDARAANVVVDTVITLANNPAVSNSFIYSLAATDALTVTPSGAIVAPPISGGAAIFLNGNVNNQGQLRAAWGTEVQGLWMFGSTNVNASGGLIEAHNLNLGSGSAAAVLLTNQGNLQTGAFTLPDGRLLTAATFPGPGAHIANQAQLRNVRDSFSVVGRWESFSDISVQGLFANDGEFRIQRNSITAPAAPANYTPTLTVQQYYGDTGQATVFNSFFGRMRFSEGTVLLNGGLVANEGLMEIAHGARIDNSPAASVFVPTGLAAGRFENRLGGELRIGGSVNTGTYAQFINRGELVNDGDGLINVRDGGRFEQRRDFTNQGFLSRFEVESGGLASFIGGTYNSGQMVLRGAAAVQDGGTIFNAGVLFVESGGLLSVDRLGSAVVTADGGRANIAGSLLVFGEFQVSGNGNTFNPAAPGLDVLAGADVSVGGTSGRLVVTQAGSLRNAGSIAVNQDGTLHGDFGARIENLGLVEVQPGGTLRLQGNWDESFENQATGWLQVGGVVSGGVQSRLINHGRMVVYTGGSVSVPDVQQVDGSLTIEVGATVATPGGRLLMTGGLLGGTGRINGDVFAEGLRPVDPADPACRAGALPGIACFTPGASPGHMDIDGTLTLGQGAVLELEIERDAAGALHWDTVTAGSMSFLQGSLVRVLIGDTAPGAGIEALSFLNCLTGPCDYSSASFEVRGGEGGSFTFGSDGRLGFEMAAGPVPEPGTYALLLAGLGVVGHLARRRKG